MRSFEHVNALNIQTTVALLSEPSTEAIAGGTDLLGELKARLRSPQRLVNLKTLSKLREIRYSPRVGLRLGALVTLAEIERHPVVQERFPILAQAASSAATPQLRHMGTIGGNLCQKPRCWYYRNKLFHCWLKGGDICFAEDGENKYHAILGADRCHAVHPSDLAPALIALDATVCVVGPEVEGEISLEELYTKPTERHRRMTILGPGELITEIRVPPPKKNARGVYLKAMERGSWSFALVSVAAQMSLEGERITDARIALGGVAAIPWRARESERLLVGQEFSEELAERAAEAAVAGAQPLRDNGYKVPLAKSLVKRALEISIRERSDM
ncbi:MAG: xanthine dehydrogenase family protein subunit M [Candidatus Bipolaricaulota bacterium]|nr:xanthine dehydrogenase family protein subunit M [Candidatus Bipolaricaulota bacterium]MCS7274971.1 xanthine dehydrogenase family protein subunit M [Candidatus Bipolaricaulota bacterium]MDW8110346.1 xanthine dehydrogenase family protein subunit M [Candidatus Bipolaricaulota bacterium]MDW8328758.1 xanthine dehydrogenase family protein subunit M [Candidatus Bipolaricaulota bacterium]